MNILSFTISVFCISILAGLLGALTGLGGELLLFQSSVLRSRSTSTMRLGPRLCP